MGQARTNQARFMTTAARQYIGQYSDSDGLSYLNVRYYTRLPKPRMSSASAAVTTRRNKRMEFTGPDASVLDLFDARFAHLSRG
jgi:hypothetical protein